MPELEPLRRRTSRSKMGNRTAPRPRPGTHHSRKTPCSCPEPARQSADSRHNLHRARQTPPHGLLDEPDRTFARRRTPDPKRRSRISSVPSVRPTFEQRRKTENSPSRRRNARIYTRAGHRGFRTFQMESGWLSARSRTPLRLSRSLARNRRPHAAETICRKAV